MASQLATCSDWVSPEVEVKVAVTGSERKFEHNFAIELKICASTDWLADLPNKYATSEALTHSLRSAAASTSAKTRATSLVLCITSVVLSRTY